MAAQKHNHVSRVTGILNGTESYGDMEQAVAHDQFQTRKRTILTDIIKGILKLKPEAQYITQELFTELNDYVAKQYKKSTDASKDKEFAAKYPDLSRLTLKIKRDLESLEDFQILTTPRYKTDKNNKPVVDSKGRPIYINKSFSDDDFNRRNKLINRCVSIYSEFVTLETEEQPSPRPSKGIFSTIRGKRNTKQPLPIKINIKVDKRLDKDELAILTSKKDIGTFLGVKEECVSEMHFTPSGRLQVLFNEEKVPELKDKLKAFVENKDKNTFSLRQERMLILEINKSQIELLYEVEAREEQIRKEEEQRRQKLSKAKRSAFAGSKSPRGGETDWRNNVKLLLETAKKEGQEGKSR